MGVVALVGCASPVGEDAAASESAIGEASSDPVTAERVPEPQAFKAWSDDHQAVSEPRPESVARTTVHCADKTLYPTHPQSDLKRYHRYAHGRYDAFKVPASSEVCKIRGGTAARPICLATATLEYAMLSDTYRDTCGNLYRGFWDQLYLSTQETMGTLMSRGRRVFEVPSAQFAGEVYDADTYGVAEREFLFLADAFPGDKERVERAKQSAIAAGTHRYDAATHVFEYVGPYR